MPAGALDVDPEKHHLGDQHAQHAQTADADRLQELGYKQDLKRSWSVLESFGVSFSIISVVTGLTTLFSFGLNTGGPGVMVCGWIFCSFFTLFVALSMAEIVSSCPTSGGPYHWSSLLASPKYSPFCAWVTAWFNLLGQVAVTTGITFGEAGLISNLASVGGFEPTPAKTLGIYAAIIGSHGLINTFGIRTLAFFNRSSIAIHSLGVGSLAIALLAKAPTHRSAREVFATFYDGTGDPGWSIRASPAYVAVIGILLSQFTLTGFDASAHMAEETNNAARAAPIGVITAVSASSCFGFFLLCSYLFSMQDLDQTINNNYGQPVLQIFVDVFGETGAIVAFSFIIVAVYHCGLFSITSNSRMMYSFARDSGLPRWFAHVDEKWSSPIRAVWLAVVLAFLLAVPSLGSSVAYAAATSISTIGLYISYALPVAIMLLNQQRFKRIRGPFNLGRFSKPVAMVTCCYVIFLTVVFCLPTVNPVDSQTLNYTPICVGVVLAWSLGSWFLWAHKWFVGPRSEALGEMQKEPGVNAGAIMAADDKDVETKEPTQTHEIRKVLTDQIST
ncbi:polyamine transporter tpo5 [Microbotryomycetes sp. JL221]|nr:polyamine transporter tpo5 [Microbotryomycetes sp. JL221]